MTVLGLLAGLVFGFALVSRRLEGTVVTAAMVFVAAGLVARVDGPRRLRQRDARRSGPRARGRVPRRRAGARAAAVRRGGADRSAPSARQPAAGAPAGDRAAADDRPRHVAGRSSLLSGPRAVGVRDRRRRARADRRRARPGGRLEPARAAADARGAQRRERAQRRRVGALPDAVHRPRGGARGARRGLGAIHASSRSATGRWSASPWAAWAACALARCAQRGWTHDRRSSGSRWRRSRSSPGRSRTASAATASSPRSSAGAPPAWPPAQLRERMLDFAEEEGELLNLAVFFIFGVFAAEALDGVTWQMVAYAVLSLTVIRMLPVALAVDRARAATVDRRVHRLVRAPRPGLDHPRARGRRGGARDSPGSRRSSS